MAPSEVDLLTRSYALKRVVDIALSLAGICVLSPVLIAIAFAIRISSRGPIIFRQQRLGLHERPFEIMKFRTMHVDAEQQGPQFTSQHDPRITRVGRVLRNTSLDELPQLFNVLGGSMSLIGPRPYVGFELESMNKTERRIRASVKPGISGLAQVSGRSSIDQDDIVRLDQEYATENSLSMDLRIVFRTISVVLRQRGTN